MSDQELERRLSSRLHERFDAATPSVALRTRIAADRERERGVGRSATSWFAPLRAAAGVAAVLVLVVAGVFAAGSGFGVGPLAARTSPTPAPTIGPAPSDLFPGPSETPGASPWETTYRLPPVEDATPSKSVGEAAVDAVQGRIRALGYGTFTVAAGDVITAIVPGPVGADVVNALLWPGGVDAFVVSADEAVGLDVDHAVPPGLSPVFVGANVVRVTTPEGPGTEDGIQLELDDAAAVRLANATEQAGGALLIADGTGRIHHLVHVLEPIHGSLVITAGSNAAEEPLAVLGAVLAAPPMPDEWSSGQLSVSSTGEAVEALYLSSDLAFDEPVLLAGTYRLTEKLSVPDAAPQCHLEVDLVPVGGGLPFVLTPLSIAPGSGVEHTEAVEIPAAAYTVDVQAECGGWSVALER